MAVVRANGVYQATHNKQVLLTPSQLPPEVTKDVRRQVRQRSSSIRRAGRIGGIFGLGLLLWNADAAADEMVETLETIAEDCRYGNEDWAYVGLLTLRHEANQQALFSGDIAMRTNMQNLGW